MVISKCAGKVLLLASLVSSVAAMHGQRAVEIDSQNPRYLFFRNKPIVLLAASEHYGSVINRPFDFEKYLDDAALHRMTVTRTFLLYRELQSARNPSSPCKPESPDYIAPWPRVGPETALDGEPIYDLDHWNPEYFARLHAFLDAASKRGIIVELTLFSNTYSENTWALNPLRAENNRQHVGKIDWEEYITLKNPELVWQQKEYLRKILEETSGYDNVYYEICNEPGGGIPGHATPEEVDAWQEEMARLAREELKKLGRPHLLAGQQAFTYGSPNVFPMDRTFDGGVFDIVNDHPLPYTEFGGKTYDMGNFMSKELNLAEVAAFCRAAYEKKKPTVLDEDNTASMYRDNTGWIIHRKRAWTALMNGANYDYIDFSITVGSEQGTPASRAAIRSWMEYLSDFMASFDYVHSAPSLEWIRFSGDDLVGSGFVSSNRDFVAYLADAREVKDTSAGQPIHTNVRLTLPAGAYDVTLYSPKTGQYSPGIRVSGGADSAFDLPAFTDDVVLRATRIEN
jgi:hypothetical protein